MEVNRDALLPTILLREVHRDPSDARPSRTREITLWRLDLDNPRAQVDECLPARRARQHARQIEYLHAGEWSRASHIMSG
jgi:hypothetical protein